LVTRIAKVPIIIDLTMYYPKTTALRPGLN